jgi:hypothetical protein
VSLTGFRFRVGGQKAVWRTPNGTRWSRIEEDAAERKQIDMSLPLATSQVRRVTNLGSSPTRPTTRYVCRNLLACENAASSGARGVQRTLRMVQESCLAHLQGAAFAAVTCSFPLHAPWERRGAIPRAVHRPLTVPLEGVFQLSTALAETIRSAGGMLMRLFSRSVQPWGR